MNQQPGKQAKLEKIRHLLSHLHGEIAVLERSMHTLLAQMDGQLALASSSVSTKISVPNSGDQNLDDLTGLLRRNGFLRKAEELREEGRRMNQGYGLLVIDIDHFKRVNDTHGHLTGDEVIKKVAGLLRRFEGPRCHIGRWGGEEFVVATLGTDAEIVGLAEMIRRGAERLHGPIVNADGEPSSNVHWRCTISAGLATLRGLPERPGLTTAVLPRLLQAADLALHQAKARGRNQVRTAA